MLSISRKTDYALAALAYMLERPAHVSSAREIAEASGVPLALLMNVLKALHQDGILRSTRGIKGGYQIDTDLGRISIYELIGTLHPSDSDKCLDSTAGAARFKASLLSPVQALQYKLARFLQDVKLSDLLTPGRRIDVPVERVGIERIERGGVTGAAGVNLGPSNNLAARRVLQSPGRGEADERPTLVLVHD